MIIGSHNNLKAPDYFLGAVKEAIQNGANTMMVYTGAPQNTIRVNTENFKIKEANLLKKDKIHSVFTHAPYIINLAQQDQTKRDFAVDFLTNEIIRSEKLGAIAMVLHPGNFLSQELDIAINLIAEGINKIFENTKDLKCKIALETMAGKGTEVGRKFIEIKKIIDKIKDKNRIAVCLDTCHIFDGGYDLINNYDDIFKEFDEVIGLNKLVLIHLNDSKFGLNSHKDRHANIGFGLIGFNPLLKVCLDPKLKDVPKVLETPYVNGNSPYKLEIEMLKKGIFNSNLLDNLS